jgi:hypothetical protein
MTIRRWLVLAVTSAAIGSCAVSIERLRAADQADIAYGVAPEPWAEGLGNHRARVNVAERADAVWVRIPWRRRDSQPDRKDSVVVEAVTNRRVENVRRVNINRQFGDIIFQPPSAGEYFIYYLPYQTQGSAYFPTTVYESPRDTADAAWSKKCEPLAKRIETGDTEGIPRAQVVEIQAINSFHRFDLMEIVAAPEEVERLKSEHAERPYLLFPENRRFPIRMNDELPLRWIRSGPGAAFEDSACRGEFYTFQIGLYASKESIVDLAVDFSDLVADGGQIISTEAMRCFNLGGIDCRGQMLRKKLDVSQGKVQPLWFGVQVPQDAAPATYRGTISLRPKNAAATTVKLVLTVADEVLADGGDGDLWRHSRLRWLDSTRGLDDEVVSPFSPIALTDRTLQILGRQIRFNELGLLDSIQSTFTRNVDGTDAPAKEILAAPMRFVVDRAAWAGNVKVVDQAPGAVTCQSNGKTETLEFECVAKAECDGYVNFKITLRANEAADLKDIALEIPLRRQCVPLMMGMGHKGGRRPQEWNWTWDENRANNQLWIGDVDAGIALKLKHVEDRWDLYNLKQTGTYRDWSNGGQGGCTVREEGETVIVRAYAGPRKVAAGETLHFNFGLMITPFKPLDKRHWNWRYLHQHAAPTVAGAASQDATIVNIHQADPLNPHINYPFLNTEKLSEYVREAHNRNLKVKLYYTVRELSNYAPDLWMLRSLGDEIFLDGPGFKLADQFDEKKPDAKKPSHTGSSWLCEHVVSGYVPAWHDPLGPGHYDAAIATTGLSRWHNYYLEGLDWLCRNVQIDGLYLDGVGYDREIMKRVRKVLDRARPGSLLDFHSGNNFHLEYGLSSPANQYLELFPYIDSLWLGEGYHPDEPPDYWLVEMSGIPYGLFGEMLAHGGNPWRGMLYGMTNRLGWSGDPRPIWKLWDEFGIRDAQMIGYWDPTCPVKTDNQDVLATVYRKKDKVLIAMASWANEPRNCRLKFDWKALGMDPKNTELFAPHVPGLQSAATKSPADVVVVPPREGAWFILETKHLPD